MPKQPPNTLEQIQTAVCNFRDSRNWRQFHSPKNLSMSIAIEAAELMEHFQWLTPEQAGQLIQKDKKTKEAVQEELADILIYCLSLADVLACDVAETIFDKIKKNEAKYPAEKYWGQY